MGGRRKADIEHIKSFVTRQNDGHVRLAYARCPESLPRRFILVSRLQNSDRFGAGKNTQASNDVRARQLVRF